MTPQNMFMDCCSLRKESSKENKQVVVFKIVANEKCDGTNMLIRVKIAACSVWVELLFPLEKILIESF